MENLFDELERRGLYADCTDPAALRGHLQRSRSVYCGFDPTADSLHIGSLVPIIMLKRFQMYGHTPILLIGGGTGLVGDPAGKAEERQLSEEDAVKDRAESLKNQVAKFLKFSEDVPNKAIIVDNYSWLKGLGLIEFLRDYGKIFSLGELLNNRYVKARLNDPDSTISFAEFAYTLLQAFDFVELYKKHACTIQIGGTDQWGNITNGTRLARGLKLADILHGITLPLIVQDDGTKFGKTESGNIWLDPKKTPVFDFYQYFIRINDSLIEKAFYTFSLKSKADIDQILASDRKAPENRLALRALAFEITEFVHGPDNALACQTLASILFPSKKEERAEIEDKHWEVLANSGIVPVIDITSQMRLVDALVSLGLTSSKAEARRLLANKGIRLNLSLQPDKDMNISEIEMLSSGLICIQKGKSCGIIRR